MIFSLLKNQITNNETITLIDKLQKRYIELEKLIQKLDECDMAYYIESKPIIDDAEYDGLKNKMQLIIAQVIEQMQYIEKLELVIADEKAIKKAFSSIKSALKKRANKVGAKTSRKFKKVKHRRPMLSLSNCFNEDDIAQFMSRVGQVDEITCELKIDGVSFSALYEDGKLQLALTRGDGEIGEDITLNVKQIKDLPHEISYKGILEIRGEIYMDKSTFADFNDFSTPRNAASGSIRQLDPMITRNRNLKYFVWDVDVKDINSHYARMLFVKELGFCVNTYISVARNISEMIDFYEKIAMIRSTLDYDIDGIVYKIDDIRKQDELGTTASSPRWATAYKFQAAEAVTHITDIIIQIGKSGALIPVAVLEPINIGGTVISRATLHNAGELKRHGYSVGDLVKVIRSGDVIPKIIGVITKSAGNEFVMPIRCPICSSDIIDDGTATHKLCTGGWNCKGQMIERLKHFVSRDAFNIVGLGNKQIAYFVEEGKIRIFADIFKLENNNYLDPLQNKHGWGNKSVSELFQSISQATKIELHKFLYSLAIPHVGSEIALLLSREFKTYSYLVESINSADALELLKSINGIGDQITMSVIQFFKDEFNYRLLSDLMEYIEITPYTERGIVQIFAFTGALESITRIEAEELVMKSHSTFSSSVTKKVTYLVVGDKPSASKINQAKKLSIQLINEEEFLRLIS